MISITLSRISLFGLSEIVMFKYTLNEYSLPKIYRLRIIIAYHSKEFFNCKSCYCPHQRKYKYSANYFIFCNLQCLCLLTLANTKHDMKHGQTKPIKQR